MSSDLKSNFHQNNLTGPKSPDCVSYSFEDYRVDVEHRMLYRQEKEVSLTPKQVETLIALIERRGEIISKEALMGRLWPDSAVEESNLIQNIYVLRKILGFSSDGRPMIETLRRRGYRFNCDLKTDGKDAALIEPGFRSTIAEPLTTENESSIFVGREAELERLFGYLDQASRGNGKLVFISGEAGAGKTSLAVEFQRQIRGQRPDIILASGRCLEQYGPGEAYLPFLDAFGALLNSRSREITLTELRTHAPTWCLQFPAELSSSGILEQLQRETLGATKERMLREMSDAMGGLTARSPVVLLIEDLHWADPSSVDLLRQLSQRLNGRRLLIIGVLRPENMELGKHPLHNFRGDLLARNICSEIALGSLSAATLARYLDARFTPNNFSSELSKLLERKTEGHPLFATSFVDHLLEQGDIAEIEGIWTLNRQLAEVDIEAPENVYSVIRKNVEALDKSELRPIQYASIEGGEFLSTVVAELLGIDDLALEEQLDNIGRVHRLVQVCGQEDLPNGDLAIRYRFSHILYQNFLYGDLAPKRRILLHRQAAELLLKLYGPQAERIAVQLAMHFERARNPSRAIEFLIIAADNARKVFANDEAEQYLTHALQLVEKLPPEEQVSKYADLLHKRGVINQALSRFDQAIDDFTRMSEMGRRGGQRDVEHAALNAMGTTLFWAHRMDEMAACVDKVRSFVEVSENQALRLESMVIMALRHQCYGELSETKPLYEEVIEVARSINHKPALLSALVWRSFVHFFQSEYERAETLLTEARELAIESRDGFRLLNCLFCLGVVQGNRGCISKALGTFNEALEIAMRNGDHAVRAKLPNCIGWIYRELQDFDRAREYDRRGVEIAREDRVLEAEAHSLLNLGNNYSIDGESDRSLAAFREAEIVFGNDDWLRWRFNIRHQAGQAEYWLEQGNLQRAKEHSLRLLDLATSHDVHKYIAVAHKLLGQIASANANYVEAENHFAIAIDELNKYPAPFVTWKTDAALGSSRLKNGEVDRAKAAFAQALRTIQLIASNIDDESLRSTFLNSAAVQKVIDAQAAISS